MSGVSQVGAPQPVFLGSLLSVLDATGELPSALEELRARFDRVKAHYDSGELTPDRFAGMISTLRCYDEAGNAWTIGATSGLWYRLTDDGWLQSPPPYSRPEASVSAAGLYRPAVAVPATPAATPAPAAEPEPAEPEPAADREDELLFGLPAQLFSDEPTPAGPVPYGTLPTPAASEDLPAPRAEQDDHGLSGSGG